MLPILQIGPLAIKTPGLIILLGLWVGLTLSERYIKKYCITNPNDVYNLVFIILISGLIGSRLAYIFLHFDTFVESPISAFSLNPGLLDLSGGAAFGFVGALIYGNRKNLSLWLTLDALTPLFATLEVALGLVHLASGDAFGAETDLPWAIELWGAKRHPSQIYEIVLGIVIFIAVWRWSRYSPKLPKGTTFLLFIILSSISRLFLEAFRGDSNVVLGNFRSIQLIAWIILAISLWGLGRMLYNISEEDMQ
jgi:prolipoprotein diacylglyceryl transferase